MKANTTDKLLIGLTGKEVYQAAMMHWIDRVQHNPLRFSETDVKKAISALARRPHELHEYNLWCQASDSIELTQAELRVEAMYTVWKLTALLFLIIDSPNKTLFKNEPNIIQETYKDIKTRIEIVESFHMVLEAYGKVLGCDVPAFAQREYDELKSAVHNTNFVLEKCGHLNLSPLTLDSGKLPPDIMQQFISAIERGNETSHNDIMHVLIGAMQASEISVKSA
jgi:hypothetical protein